MIYYERIGTDVNKTSASKECKICHYRLFIDNGFTFQSYIYNGCHDLSMLSMKPNNIAILNIRSVDYCCIINRASESKAINVFKNVNLSEKNGSL